jgi:hypothetical protein
MDLPKRHGHGPVVDRNSIAAVSSLRADGPRAAREFARQQLALVADGEISRPLRGDDRWRRGRRRFLGVVVLFADGFLGVLALDAGLEWPVEHTISVGLLRSKECGGMRRRLRQVSRP